MGRALVRHPRAFLMDEPLSNLDARLRGQMRVEIARLQRAAGVTTVYVTHDQVEAMTMADRVAVMRDGSLQQLGAPRELYDRPVNLFVAGFIGAPPINLLSGALRSAGQGVELELADARILLPPELIQRRSGLMGYHDREIIVGVRPEAASVSHEPEAELSGVVAFQEDLGATMVTTVELGVAARREGAIVEDLSESGVPRVSTRMRIVAQSGARRVASQAGPSRARPRAAAFLRSREQARDRLKLQGCVQASNKDATSMSFAIDRSEPTRAFPSGA